MTPGEVLLVDDDEEMRLATVQALELAGFRVRHFPAAERVIELCGFGFKGIVISDIRMPGMDGMTLMTRIHDLDTDIPVILITGHATLEDAIAAVRIGAFDFVRKPFRLQEIFDATSRAMARAGERRKVAAAQGHLVGASGAGPAAGPSTELSGEAEATE